jgi:ribonuclease HII
MAVLVGIDEAGYGPLLGPLVVSYAAFRLPTETLQSDLWQLLNRSVTQTARRAAGRLLITDSKKAHSKSAGIKHLERTTLAACHVLGRHPDTIASLMEILDPPCLPRLREYPWYGGLECTTLTRDEADIGIAGNALVHDLKRQNMAFLGVKSLCLDVAYYNKRVEVVRNKSNVLFTETCCLLQQALALDVNEDLQVVIDRQGGRIHYSESLLRMFPGAALSILKETEQMSSYEMSYQNRRTRLHFVVKADARCLPASLASMVSKYVRELLVKCLNDYFIRLCPTLKPTAGYWQDGQRFVKDLKQMNPEQMPDKERLIRSR